MGQDLCGKWMLRKRTMCARTPGHGGSCKTAEVMERQREYSRPNPHRDFPAVRAAALAGITAGTAGEFAPMPVGAGGVDRAEAWGGESGEHAGVGGDGGGDAFDAGQAGADDLAGVVLVYG